MTGRPRFIAGAVCPACGAMDRLQVLGSGDRRLRRCVACGHEDGLDAGASRPPKSRLDAPPKGSAGDEPRPVRILDAGTGRPGHGDGGAEPDEGR